MTIAGSHKGPASVEYAHVHTHTVTHDLIELLYEKAPCQPDAEPRSRQRSKALQQQSVPHCRGTARGIRGEPEAGARGPAAACGPRHGRVECAPRPHRLFRRRTLAL